MRNKIRLAMFLVVVLVVAIGLMGCGTKNETSNTNDTANKDQNSAQEKVKSPKIVVLLTSLSGRVYVSLAYGILEEAKKMGIEQPQVLAAGGSDKLEVQVKQIDDMIAAGMDVMIIMPLAKDGITPAIDRAVDAGIKVLEMGNDSNSTKVQARIRTDQVAAGKKMGEHVAKKLNGKGNIVMFNGPPGTAWSQYITDGFKGVMKDYPDIKILTEKYTAFDAGVAMNTMNDVLQAFPEIDYIHTCYDVYAEGVISALDAAGLKGKMPVCTENLTPSTLEWLKDGSLDYVVGTGSVAMGQLVLQTAVKLANGEEVPPMQSGHLIDYYGDTIKSNPNVDTSADFYPEGWLIPQ